MLLDDLLDENPRPVQRFVEWNIRLISPGSVRPEMGDHWFRIVHCDHSGQLHNLNVGVASAQKRGRIVESEPLAERYPPRPAGYTKNVACCSCPEVVQFLLVVASICRRDHDSARTKRTGRFSDSRTHIVDVVEHVHREYDISTLIVNWQCSCVCDRNWLWHCRKDARGYVEPNRRQPWTVPTDAIEVIAVAAPNVEQNLTCLGQLAHDDTRQVIARGLPGI